MQKDGFDDTELMSIMDEFKKVAKTKDSDKKKAIKELKKANPGKEAAEINVRITSLSVALCMSTACAPTHPPRARE